MSKISVIVPVYNQRLDYLQEAIDSIFNQTRVPDEIIIIDDGSEPSLKSTLKSTTKFRDNLSSPPSIVVKIIRNEKNMGIGFSRQRGANEATGDYIAFLSSDDVWDKDFLKIMKETAEKMPDKILYSHYYFIDEIGKIIGIFNPAGYEDHEDFCIASWEAAKGNTMFVNFRTVFIPKKVFEKVKFDESLRFGEDLDFLLRSMKDFEYFLVQEPLLKYRAFENTTSKNIDKIPKNNIKIREKCWEYWGVKHDNIFEKKYWDDSVLSGRAEEAILDGYTKEKFWNEEVEIKELTKDTVFLDIGCGIGRIAKWVAPKVKEYWGIDFSEEMINKAIEIYKDYKNVCFFVNNGKEFKALASESFDIAYINLVFQHMTKENMISYIDETFRVLKKEGIFLANSIPKSERYVNGLTKEELEKAFSKFKILERNETPFYYNLKCQK